MLIGLCSLKSSPGVTTTALALAGCWPVDGERPVVVEMDARGGDVAWRFGLSAVPGLRTLAAATRLNGDAGLVAAHAQTCGDSAVMVVAAPVEREAAAQAAGALTGLLDLLAGAPEPVLVDLGEVDPGDSDTVELLGRVSVVLVVVRAVPDQIARLRASSSRLIRANSAVQAVVVGDVSESEASGLIGLPVAGVLPLIDSNRSGLSRALAWRSRKAFGTSVLRLAQATLGIARSKQLVMSQAAEEERQ